MRVIVIILLLTCQLAVAQDEKTRSLDQYLEKIIQSGDDDLDYENLYESLAQQTSNPLSLNHATRDALLALNILSEQQADSLISYRIRNGDLVEIYELQSVPMFDLETIRSLLPFVALSSSSPGKKWLARIASQHHGYFFTRYETTLQRSRGFSAQGDSSSAYPGTQARIYSRLRVTSPGQMSFGFTAEQDAGESFQWTQKQFGFDFYSSHLQLMGKKAISNMIVGDFTAQFGQGLTLGGGFGIGKGSETITTLRRTSTGFMPYSSANESGFFRGMAISWRLSQAITLHTFGSSLPRDGSTPSEDGSSSLSILQSGKHRTMTEQSTRHTLRENNFGICAEYRHRSVNAGLLAHKLTFGLPVNKSTTVYNSFDMSGQGYINFGAFASWTVRNLSLFGEASNTLTHGSGYVGGVIGTVNRNTDFSLLFRHYDRNYYSLYTNAISENTIPKNETGLYWGWKQAISKRLSYTTYVDLFRFPWLKFRNYAPSDGSEFLVRLNYKPSRSTDFYLQYRNEQKTRNASAETQAAPTYQVLPTSKSNYVLSGSWSAGSFTTRVRLQGSTFHQAVRTVGFAMAFDAGYDWQKVSVTGRFAIFDSDDFDNRQYMNERDVLMAFSFPSLYGEGTRRYVVIRYQPLKWMDLWVKAASTNYFRSTTVGSGLDQIAGDRKHDLKMEIVFHF